jgi:hypothetical protein
MTSWHHFHLTVTMNCWAMAVAVEDSNCHQNGGGHQHCRLMLTAVEWMRMVRVQE